MHDTHSIGEPSFLRGTRARGEVDGDHRGTAYRRVISSHFSSKYTQTTSLFTRARAVLCMRTTFFRRYTEHGICTNRGNIDLSSSRTIEVLHHTRESDKDASQLLFHMRNCECGKQLISWNGVNLTHGNLPVYLGSTLDRTLSYEAYN